MRDDSLKDNKADNSDTTVDELTGLMYYSFNAETGNAVIVDLTPSADEIEAGLKFDVCGGGDGGGGGDSDRELVVMMVVVVMLVGEW